MELDEQEASGSSSEIIPSILNLDQDTEPLPQVMYGSETWHSQIPAVSVLSFLFDPANCFAFRIGFLLSPEIVSVNGGKTSSSHLVMLTYQECPARGAK